MEKVLGLRGLCGVEEVLGFQGLCRVEEVLGLRGLCYEAKVLGFRVKILPSPGPSIKFCLEFALRTFLLLALNFQTSGIKSVSVSPKISGLGRPH